MKSIFYVKSVHWARDGSPGEITPIIITYRMGWSNRSSRCRGNTSRWGNWFLFGGNQIRPCDLGTRLKACDWWMTVEGREGQSLIRCGTSRETTRSGWCGGRVADDGMVDVLGGWRSGRAGILARTVGASRSWRGGRKKRGHTEVPSGGHMIGVVDARGSSNIPRWITLPARRRERRTGRCWRTPNGY